MMMMMIWALGRRNKISRGRSTRSKVRMMLCVGTSTPFFLDLIRRAEATPKAARPSAISSSLTSSKSSQYITPLEAFFVLWADTDIGTRTCRLEFPSFIVKMNSVADIACFASLSLVNSTSIPPSLSLSQRETLPKRSHPSFRWKGEREESFLLSLVKISTLGVDGFTLLRDAAEVLGLVEVGGPAEADGLAEAGG